MKYKILNDLLTINTVEDKENEKFRKYIKNFLLPLNFTFEELGETDKKLLIAKRKNSQVAFICHTDTVKSSRQWTKEPFCLTEEGGYLYGLGISDMKGGIAALLETIESLDKEIPCMAVFTFDEEINFTGIKQAIKNKIEFPPYLIFTEPTNNQPVIANKGCLEFSLKFPGKSTHSSTPNLGENAIYKAMTCIGEIKSLASNIQQEKTTLYEVETTTFNLSKIKGGEEINKVPDQCEITFDFRTIVQEHNEYLKQEIIELAEKYKATVTILNDLGAVQNKNKEMIAMLEKITTKKSLGLNYGTEASFFSDKDICILGPGPITAHEKDEKISKKSYQETKKIYQEIILTINKK